MTDLEIQQLVRDAITNQFREKLRAELPDEHKHVADSDASLDILLGGVFAIDVLHVENQPIIKIKIEGQIRSIIERLSGTVVALVDAVMTSAKQAEADGGIRQTYLGEGTSIRFDEVPIYSSKFQVDR